jgi:hypothetical protein
MNSTIKALFLTLCFTAAAAQAGDVRASLTRLARTLPARSERAVAAMAVAALNEGRRADARSYAAALPVKARAKGFGHGYAIGYRAGWSDGLAGRYVDHRPSHGDPARDAFYQGYEEGWAAATFQRL